MSGENLRLNKNRALKMAAAAGALLVAGGFAGDKLANMNDEPVAIDHQRHSFTTALADGKIPDGYVVKTINTGETLNSVARDLASDGNFDEVKSAVKDQVGTEDGGINAGDRVLLNVNELKTAEEGLAFSTYPIDAGILIDGQTGTVELPIVMSPLDQSISQK